MTPAASVAFWRDDLPTLYHGTSLESAVLLLQGAPLCAAFAQDAKIDGPLGFYLATDPAVAEFFAYRRGRGGVLVYRFATPAIVRLRGSVIGPQAVPRGGFPTEFPGFELVVPITAFDTFNGLRVSGLIEVRAYRRSQE